VKISKLRFFVCFAFFLALISACNKDKALGCFKKCDARAQQVYNEIYNSTIIPWQKETNATTASGWYRTGCYEGCAGSGD
jgi:hypothetical protein